MARTAEGAALTDLHRRQQLALRAAVVRDVMKLWPMWAPKDPGSYLAFETAMVLLVQSRSALSATIAARYYRAFSALESPGVELVGDLGQIALAARPPVAQIRASLSATSRAGVFRALGAGQSYAQAMANGLVEVSGAASRLAMNSGRDTIVEAVQHDPRALGWARVTDSAPCAFCAMLASRGPVYKKETAVRTKGGRRYHDHCGCTAEPVYEGSEWPGRAREFRDLWEEGPSLSEFRRKLATGEAPAARPWRDLPQAG